jgi:metal-responsive CopG/Arc/MetJ family transcriptional regulator
MEDNTRRFISLKETAKIIKALDQLAKLKGTNRSVLIRQLIRDYILSESICKENVSKKALIHAQ